MLDFIKPNCKYRILDSNWFALTNLCIVHLAEFNQDTKEVSRLYYYVKKPIFDFYMKRNNTTRVFQEEANLLEKHSCEYNNRFNYIADLLSFNKERIKSTDFSIKQQARNELMASPTLFRADDRIELQVMNNLKKALEKLELYDEGIIGKRLYFDIETSGLDFDAAELELFDLLLTSKTSEEYKTKTFSDYKKLRTLNKYPKLKDNISNYVERLDSEFNPINHRLATELARDCEKAMFSNIKRRIKSDLKRYQFNVGEVNEMLANDRVDTITSFEGKTLYFDFLLKEEILSDEYLELLSDVNKIESIYGNFFRLSMFKFDINNLGKTEKKQFLAEFGDEMLKDFFKDVVKYSENLDFNIANELFEVINEKYIVGKFDKYSSYPVFDFKFFVYKSEMSLIHAFLERVKNVIKPSYMVAHNHRYDLMYLKNRPLKFGYQPAEWFCQYDEGLLKETLDLETMFKVDDVAENYKKNKSHYSALGLIQADTMLLDAKASFKEKPSNSLDFALQTYFKESKFKYAAKSIVHLYATLDHWIKYSGIDTVSLQQFDSRKNLIELRQSMLEGHTVWSRYYAASEITVNTMKLLYEDEFQLEIQNNPNNYLSDVGELFEEALIGGFVTNPVDVNTTGVYKYVVDSDASGQHPSTMITSNTFPDKLILQFVDQSQFRLMLSNPTRYVEEIGGKTVKRMIEEMIKLKGDI